MKYRVLAVVVTYNRLALLKEAISSLRDQTYSCDVLVVNNGSSDGTKDWLETQSDLIVINQDNVGGAGGFYTGLKFGAESKNYDFVWAMDDDVITASNALEELLVGYNLLSDVVKKVGILASKVVDSNCNPVNIPRIKYLSNISGYQDWPRFLEHGIIPIDIATFVSLLIPVKVINSEGLPIKEFFIWGDDTEYTLRVSMNFSNFCIGKSLVTHLRNGGILSLNNMEDPSRINMYSYNIRNRGYMIKKGYYGDYGLRHYIYIQMREIVKYMVEGKFDKCRTILKGLFNCMFFNPIIEYPKVK